MSRLVDDLFNLAKLDEGRPLERRQVDLSALAADAARDAGAVDPGSTDHDGPAADGRRASSLGDEDRLRQVIANIVGNALVHTPAGTAIELRVDVGGADARLAVTDHGPGMPPDVAAKVTQRFYRADPARARHRGGSGLGHVDRRRRRRGPRRDDRRRQRHRRGTTVTVALPLAASSPENHRESVRSGSLDGRHPPTHLPRRLPNEPQAPGGGRARGDRTASAAAPASCRRRPTTTVHDRRSSRTPTTRVTDDTVTDDTATDDTTTDDTTTDDGSTEPGEARTRPDGAPEGCDEAGSGTASGSTEETPSSVVQP